MLQDSITLAPGATIEGFVAETPSGANFPGSPYDGQKFRLTAATSTYEAGEYTYNLAATEWQNTLVLLAKNASFAATGKKGSNVNVAVGKAIESGTDFPSSPYDGQKFRLTAATSTYEAGEYTYSLSATEWLNALVTLAKNTSFAAIGKKGSGVAVEVGKAIASGTAFPGSPYEGQKFRLTAATATYEAGEYTYTGSEWLNTLVTLGKNTSFLPATAKKGSAVSVEVGKAIASGTDFPSSPYDGQKFRLTAATATYEIGEYTYNLAATEWQNTLVTLAKNASFKASTAKKGSSVSVDPNVSPYDIGFQILGKPDASAVVGRFIAVRAYKLAAAFAGAYAKSGVAATASTILLVKKNGTQVGTVTFAAAGTTGTFAAATETSFAVGDVLTVTAPASQDATFADAEITFPTTLV